MNTRIVFAVPALVLVLACDPSAPPAPAAQVDRGARVDGSRAQEPEAEEPSDLDRPVEELIALTCEHARKTFECDECRYEVGFVRAPASLAEGGLVTTLEVARQRVAESIALTGEVRFDERRIGHVSTQVEGIIKQVHVALGDRVRRGQALLEIESVLVGEAQAAYLEAQGLLELARRNAARVSELRKESIASEKEFLQARQELEVSEIRAAGALSKLSRLGTGGTAGGRVVVRAPMDGTVLLMHAVPGEVARTAESLVTVGDNTAVWVWADLYERDIAAVKRGQAAQKLAASISVKAYPGEEFPGTVDLVSPAMDESSRTVKVRVEVLNPEGRLLAGMFAAVVLSLPGTEETLAVPRASVLEDEGRAFVFVHHQGEYYLRRPVQVGRSWDGWTEIVQGLAPGQTVVAEGAFLMKSDVLRSKMGAGCAD
ncbi:MAG TPA: efflux RND transporter periplasmic adaptor subunit [Myxococcota bacterium]|nr:efflux RND transporter periplasmic adaptor subunit [Myxococcota bacterium]HRY96912.1 efflux RND transporter periplasmic adaptor subunit [Myxococcota bacterium]HSA22710.1 efflux RND transporter periplasmic adaptor subunit [Myxococcota bacterium]